MIIDALGSWTTIFLDAGLVAFDTDSPRFILIPSPTTGYFPDKAPVNIFSILLFNDTLKLI